MLTELNTVKVRLGISLADVTNDGLLNQLIAGVSCQFERECGRRFERTVDYVQEFAGEDMEIVLQCYPLESITLWESKASEALGWVERTDADPIVRLGCVVSLSTPLGAMGSRGRLTYTGGYVVPPGVPGAGQTALPKDLEAAATEQVGFLFQRRSALGLSRTGPSTADYVQVEDLELTPAVRSVLRRYRKVV